MKTTSKLKSRLRFYAVGFFVLIMSFPLFGQAPVITDIACEQAIANCSETSLIVNVTAERNSSPIQSYELFVDGVSVEVKNTSDRNVTFTRISGASDVGKTYMVRVTDVGNNSTDRGGTISAPREWTKSVNSPPFPPGAKLDNTIFPVTTGKDFVDPVINYHGPYTYFTDDAILLSQYATAVGSNPSATISVNIPYLGGSYNCKILTKSTFQSKLLSSSNETFFLDEGIFTITGSIEAIIKDNLQIVGAKTGNESIISTTSDNFRWYIYNSGENSLFENVVFNGNNKRLNYYYMHFENGPSGTSNGFTLKKVKFRNIGSSTSWWWNRNYSVLDFIDREFRNVNMKRYFIDVTIESARLSPRYGPVNINSTDGVYFRNLDIQTNTGHQASIHISNSMNWPSGVWPGNNYGNKYNIFAGTLTLPPNKVIWVKSFDSRHISFPDSWRFLALNPFWAKMNRNSYAIAVSTKPQFTSQVGGAFDWYVTQRAYVDVSDGTYVVRGNKDRNAQLGMIKDMLEHVDANNMATLPNPTIKMIDNIGDEIGGFTVPDYGTKTTHIVSLKTIDDPLQQDPMVLKYDNSTIALTPTNASYVHIYNIDFSDYFAITDAINTGNNRVTNSTLCTFYHDKFRLNEALKVTDITNDGPICSTESATFTIQGSVSTVTYSLDGGSTTDTVTITGGTSTGTATITTGALTSTTTLTILSLENASGCVATNTFTFSNTSTVEINALPTITGSSVVNVGEYILLTGTATATNSNAWQIAPAGIATINYSGETATITGNVSGTVTITYTNSSGCKATHVLKVAPKILALNEFYGLYDSSVGGATTSVLTNDTLDGVPANLSNVDLTKAVFPNTNTGGITMNNDGTITIEPKTPIGTYTAYYTICDKINPGNCDSAEVRVKVVAEPIIANDDDMSSVPLVAGEGKVSITNAILNDRYANTDATFYDVTMYLVKDNSNGAIILDTNTGRVDVSADATVGTHSMTYKICSIINPSNCDEAVITIVVTPKPVSSIHLEKDGVFVDENNDGFAQVGETIRYAFTVKNTGNTPLTNVSIVDEKVTVQGESIAVLEPGATDSTTFTAIYTLTEADISVGGVDNKAIVNGKTPNGNIISTTSTDPSPVNPINPNCKDCTTVTVKASNPKIALEKDGVFVDENNDGFAQVGETIRYAFTVKNTGNTPLTNVSIVDEKVTVQGESVAVLEPGATDSTTFTAIYTLTEADISAGGVDNKAIVNGKTPNGNIISATSTDPSPVSPINPNCKDCTTVSVVGSVASMTLEKSAKFLDENNDGFAQVGETIAYNFTVKNTGNVDLKNITITDDKVTIKGGPIAVLVAGGVDSTTFTAIYVLTKDDITAGGIDNKAFANGFTQKGLSLKVASFAPVPVEPIDPNCKNCTTIRVVKDTSCGAIQVPQGFSPNGDGINDTFKVLCLSKKYPNFRIKIYNRWGNKVYDYFNKGRKNPIWWDAFSTGDMTILKKYKVPVGTYFYIITNGNNDGAVKAGWLYVSY